MSFADLHRPGFVLPPAWDSASAAAFAAAGFPAVGTTSLGVAAAAGLPDAAGVTRDLTVALALRLVALPCPVSVDLEGGFSDEPAEVAALCAELAAAGVAGVNLEDGRGDALAPAGHLAAVVAAVKDSAPALFVNARTDAHWLRTGDDAVARVRAYAEAGADGVFVPGLTDEAAIAELVAAVPVPVNVLAVPGGPDLPRLAGLGARRVSLGSLPFRVALGAAVDAARAVATGRPVPGTDAPTYAEVQAYG
jgi:2-methylisocitrate lyase-like PEP mutase family enzyme